jgi:hypothetical protein
MKQLLKICKGIAGQVRNNKAFVITRQSLPVLFLFTCFSCSDMLDTDNSRVLPSDKNTLQSPNDSLYSVVGIWGQLAGFAERYVLLGELRGELMDLTDRAGADLRAIANFDYAQTPENKYISLKEYYAIINNCNYFLQHADTVRHGGYESTLKREWVTVKGFRAWIYMQLALNYGEAIYLNQPLLTLDDVDKAAQQQPISRDDLFRELIADLQPYLAWEQENDYPNYSDVLHIFTYCHFWVAHLLGDLYLWTGNYEEAAQCYHTLMRRLRLFPYTTWKYTNEGFETGRYSAATVPFFTWRQVYFDTFSYPHITVLLTDDNLKTMTSPPSPNNALSYTLMPSPEAIDLWLRSSVQIYRSDNPPYPLYYYEGDSRGASKQNNTSAFGSYRMIEDYSTDIEYMCIGKYGVDAGSSVPGVGLLRISTLYLRYAEALNNLGKPATAFTVLKYGVDDLTNPARNKNVEEVTPLPDYCDFSWVDAALLPYSWGIHAYGCGDLEYDTIYYRLPDEEYDVNLYRSFVEEKILDEYALETAFEGNRFHDLMRFALRNKDNAILAKRVARRNGTSSNLETELLEEKNWYLPGDDMQKQLKEEFNRGF